MRQSVVCVCVCEHRDAIISDPLTEAVCVEDRVCV